MDMKHDSSMHLNVFTISPSPGEGETFFECPKMSREYMCVGRSKLFISIPSTEICVSSSKKQEQGSKRFGFN